MTRPQLGPSCFRGSPAGSEGRVLVDMFVAGSRPRATAAVAEAVGAYVLHSARGWIPLPEEAERHSRDEQIPEMNKTRPVKVTESGNSQMPVASRWPSARWPSP